MTVAKTKTMTKLMMITVCTVDYIYRRIGHNSFVCRTSTIRICLYENTIACYFDCCYHICRFSSKIAFAGACIHYTTDVCVSSVYQLEIACQKLRRHTHKHSKMFSLSSSIVKLLHFYTGFLYYTFLFLSILSETMKQFLKFGIFVVKNFTIF